VLDLATVFSLVSWPGKYGEDTSRLDQISTDVGNCSDNCSDIHRWPKAQQVPVDCIHRPWDLGIAEFLHGLIGIVHVGT
jgi:hypothetical protein